MPSFSDLSQYIAILLLSIFKYGLGLFTAINSSLGFWQSIITNIIGSAIGVWFFTYMGSFIQDFFQKHFNKNKDEPNKSKKFSTKNRFLITLKNKIGLAGIAFMSPIFLTIPIGVLLALQITSNKRKIFFYIFTSCILWSWFFFLISNFFGINFSNLFKT